MKITSIFDSFYKGNIKYVAIISGFNRLYNIMAKLILMPLLINYLGKEQFGVWVVISSFLGYILFLDLGLSSGMVNKLVEYHSSHKKNEINYLISAIIYFLTIMSLFGIFICIFASIFIDWQEVLRLKEYSDYKFIDKVIYISIIIFFLQLPASIFQKITYVFEIGYISEINITLFNSIGYILLFFSIWLGLGLGLGWIIVLLNLGVLFSPWSIYIYLEKKGYLRLKKLEVKRVWRELSPLFNTSLDFLIMQITGTLMLGIPVSLIVKFHGAESATPFGILLLIIGTLQMPLVIFVQPFWVRMKYYCESKNYIEAKKIFYSYVLISLAYSPFIYIAFIKIIPLIFIYINMEGIHIQENQYTAYAIWAILGLIGGGGLSISMMALGLTRQAAILGVAQIFVCMMIAPLLIREYSDVGAAYSMIFISIFSIPLTFYMIQKKFSKLNYVE